MKRELSFHPEATFIYREANGNSSRQIEQVRELMRKGIDILIISPNEAEPLTPVVEEAYKKGIPVIIVDRKIATSYYTAYVGGNNYEIGKLAGSYALQLLKNGGNVLEITGLPKSSPAMERLKGFSDAISENPRVRIVNVLNGEWLKDVARAELSRTSLQNIDLIFAHNEMMALGAGEVYEANGMPRPKILGVDGLPGKGIDFVADKKITATMLYPTGGEEAIRLAMRIAKGNPVPKENILQTTVIDSTNVRVMQLQALRISSQQEDIVEQELKLREQRRMYNNQRAILYVIGIALLLVIVLGGLAFYSLRLNRQINRRLEAKNLEISEQKRQIEEISLQATDAHEAKVNFFTKISHEFRTPLTLILGPIEEMMAGTKNAILAQRLALVQKNVIRLMRLINQLMDFRKVDVNKMKVRATENDLVSFVADVVQSYKGVAEQRKIDLRMILKERSITACFDVSMIDKVLYNLLSNAFKFTRDGGFIHIYLSTAEAEVILVIEDNGIGMSAKAVQNAFEAFSQGDYENYKGSGLGLALSKELLNLHHGSITLQSEKDKGTRFEIRLPLGSAHFLPEEFIAADRSSVPLFEHERIYEFDVQAAVSNDTVINSGTHEYSVLFIEDNDDLRKFVAEKLAEQYEVYEAANSADALQLAFDVVPDLIISDLVIPGQDGLALTSIFKNDVRTSHIPIVLLTAKASLEQQIEGMRSMADSYITKPFSVAFLMQNLESLLKNRERLKDHFTGDISSKVKTEIVGRLDKKFISEFTSIIETNIANEDFHVENICRAMGISKVQLYRKVKALLNINVNEYIVEKRLQKAKYFLQHEEFSISEIAYKVGFSSPAYFSTVFKSKFGLTPKAFKEK